MPSSQHGIHHLNAVLICHCCPQAMEEKMQAVTALREELQGVESELADLRASYAEVCAQRKALLADKDQMEKQVGA